MALWTFKFFTPCGRGPKWGPLKWGVQGKGLGCPGLKMLELVNGRSSIRSQALWLESALNGLMGAEGGRGLVGWAEVAKFYFSIPTPNPALTKFRPSPPWECSVPSSIWGRGLPRMT